MEVTLIYLALSDTNKPHAIVSINDVVPVAKELTHTRKCVWRLCIILPSCILMKVNVEIAVILSMRDIVWTNKIKK